MPFAAFPCKCVCVCACYCGLTPIVFRLIHFSSGPASPGVADFHPDNSPALLSEQDQNC